MSSLFSTGLEALHQVEQEKLRRATESENKKFLNFFLRDGDQRMVRMYLAAPIVYWAHVFYTPGKGADTFVCTDHKNGCPLCKSRPLQSRPQQRGLMPLRWVDAEPYNDKPQDDRLFMWDMNYPPLLAFAQAVAVLKGKDVTSAPYIVTRAVSGNNSQYGFHRQDPEPFTELDQKIIAEIPAWEDYIKPPTQEQIDWILSNQAGYFPPAKGASKPHSTGAVPKPAYDRKADAPVAAPAAAPVAEEAPPFDVDDESPVRPASDFI